MGDYFVCFTHNEPSTKELKNQHLKAAEILNKDHKVTPLHRNWGWEALKFYQDEDPFGGKVVESHHFYMQNIKSISNDEKLR